MTEDEKLIADAQEWLNTLATPKMIAEEFDAIDLVARLASRLDSLTQGGEGKREVVTGNIPTDVLGFLAYRATACREHGWEDSAQRYEGYAEQVRALLPASPAPVSGEG